MKAIDIVRAELIRVNAIQTFSIAGRRALVQIAKRAKRQGKNPKSEVSRALTSREYR